MARVRVHSLCMRPVGECDCPDDDEPDIPAPGDDGSDDDGDEAA